MYLHISGKSNLINGIVSLRPLFCEHDTSVVYTTILTLLPTLDFWVSWNPALAVQLSQWPASNYPHLTISTNNHSPQLKSIPFFRNQFVLWSHLVCRNGIWEYRTKASSILGPGVVNWMLMVHKRKGLLLILFIPLPSTTWRPTPHWAEGGKEKRGERGSRGGERGWKGRGEREREREKRERREREREGKREWRCCSTPIAYSVENHCLLSNQNLKGCYVTVNN